MVYNYKHGFSGFAAKLSHSQAKAIADLPGVAWVLPNKILNMHTTRSWEFLQLTLKSTKGLLHKSKMGADTIVGVIDTGIWPESQSFNDSYMGPIPSRWKGLCQEGELFNSSNCNRKIIGARWYIKAYEAEFGPLNRSSVREFLSPRDALGHGTHTSSTAAGDFVDNVNFLGLAPGSARGGAPGARIATYKVCWATGDCSSADILAAFDDAIHDGVDVISVSLGSPPPLDAYFDDPIAIGSFHALEKGIVVVCSAGNSGPYSDTVTNTAPWLITVAASTIDRSFPTAFTLGNNQTFKGQALYTENHMGKSYNLVYAEDIASRDAAASKARTCEADSLNATLAKGKFVLCFQTRTQKPSSAAALTVYNAQGIGVIYAQIRTKTIVSSPIIPCVQVDFEVGTSILSYIQASRSPVLSLAATETAIKKTLAPQIAFFSSRGPSSLSPSILKPDIAAPGVNILAAWPPVSPPSDMPLDRRIVNFNIESGTSMSCPHVSGIVTLLKALHPRWSPAAIRSALVTTASVTDEFALKIVGEGAPQKVADPFDYGGGHVNPNKAADPGLVYDMKSENYIPFLCSMGYNTSAIHLITGKSKSNICSRSSSDLNLPTISIPNLRGKLTLRRTVTNVGPELSIYKVHVQSPPGVEVSVKPKVLSFNATGSKMSFRVILKTGLNLEGRYSFGAFVWSDGVHHVRTPIAVRTVEHDSFI
ncbi:subtilisin-like protease SBT3.9 isoform X2 [Cryptomeria japonica]|nr:subtilisin-like protease SBT3.9 isoform X2 [Cryptomeria japonica]